MTVYGLVWMDFCPEGKMEKILKEIRLLKKVLIYKIMRKRPIIHVFVPSRKIVDRIISRFKMKGFHFEVCGNKGNFIRLKNQ